MEKSIQSSIANTYKGYKKLNAFYQIIIILAIIISIFTLTIVAVVLFYYIYYLIKNRTFDPKRMKKIEEAPTIITRDWERYRKELDKSNEEHAKLMAKRTADLKESEENLKKIDEKRKELEGKSGEELKRLKEEIEQDRKNLEEKKKNQKEERKKDEEKQEIERKKRKIEKDYQDFKNKYVEICINLLKKNIDFVEYIKEHRPDIDHLSDKITYINKIFEHEIDGKKINYDSEIFVYEDDRHNIIQYFIKTIIGICLYVNNKIISKYPSAKNASKAASWIGVDVDIEKMAIEEISDIDHRFIKLIGKGDILYNVLTGGVSKYPGWSKIKDDSRLIKIIDKATNFSDTSFIINPDDKFEGYFKSLFKYIDIEYIKSRDDYNQIRQEIKNKEEKEKKKT